MENELNAEFLYEVQFDLDPSIIIPNIHGTRVIAPCTGGSFDGPKLSGKVLPGGADWLNIRSDGVGEIDVRVTLQTNDDALLYVTYHGYITKVMEVISRFSAGEEVKPDDYYFTITPYYETNAEQYQWLMQTVVVGKGYLRKGGVGYRIYAIK